MQKPQLTDEQRAIMRDKVVKLHRPVAEMIGFLAPVARADLSGGTLRTRLGCFGALAIVLSVVFVLVAANVNRLIFIVSAVLLLGGIALLVMRARAAKDDVSDNLRVTALPFLAALREDFGSGPLALHLDLRLPLSKEKQTGQQKSGSGMMKDVVTTYVDPWMSGDGLLADGSRLQWSVVDTYVERKRWKKARSGKYKQKTKTKKKMEVDVTVTLKAKNYDVGAFDAADVKRGENKSVVKVSKKIVLASAEPTPPDDILGVIAGVFRELRPAQ